MKNGGFSMRYYYYGNPEKETIPEEKSDMYAEEVSFSAGTEENSLSTTSSKTEIFGDLVIEEDTVYEIDRECLKCRENKMS